MYTTVKVDVKDTLTIGHRQSLTSARLMERSSGIQGEKMKITWALT